MKIFNIIFKVIGISFMIVFSCFFLYAVKNTSDMIDAHNRGYKQGQTQGYDSAMKQRIHVIVDSIK